ncbi:MAG: hypothetical protein JNM62_02455 [Flavobacteriales bacterium]|nr:hypothetical protein [Flavobacteriales bacterium]
MRTITSPGAIVTLVVCTLPLHHKLLAQGFPPTPIIWDLPAGGGVESNDYLQSYWWTVGEPTFFDGNQIWSSMDMNADAKPDLVVTGAYDGQWHAAFEATTNPHWRVYLSTGVGFNTTAIEWTLPPGGEFHGLNVAYGFWSLAHESTYANGNAWSTRDMNGDQLPDLVLTGVRTNGVMRAFSAGNNPYWKVHLNDGNGFTPTPLNWPVPNGGALEGITNQSFYALDNPYVGPNDQVWRTEDINGDGLDDLLVTGECNSNSVGSAFDQGTAPHWNAYLNTGMGFASAPVAWSLPGGGGIEMDGTVVGYWSTAFQDNTVGANTWDIRDMNGDGLIDLVVTAISDGFDFYALDVGTDPHWSVYMNTGSGFAQTAITWNLPQGGDIGNNGGEPVGYPVLSDEDQLADDQTGDQAWNTVDMNGDGLPDLTVTSELQEGGYQLAFPDPYKHWRVYHNLGTGFAEVPEQWAIPDGGKIFGTEGDTSFSWTDVSWSSHYGDHVWNTLDLNGDSLVDFAVTGVYGPAVAYHSAFDALTGPYWKVYLQPFGPNGISDRSAASTIDLFPNPGRGSTQLVTPEVMDEVIVRDMLGREVLHERPGSARFLFHTGAWTQGVYSITVWQSERYGSTSFVVE